MAHQDSASANKGRLHPSDKVHNGLSEDPSRVASDGPTRYPLTTLAQLSRTQNVKAKGKVLTSWFLNSSFRASRSCQIANITAVDPGGCPSPSPSRSIEGQATRDRPVRRGRAGKRETRDSKKGALTSETPRAGRTKKAKRYRLSTGGRSTRFTKIRNPQLAARSQGLNRCNRFAGRGAVRADSNRYPV